MHLLRLGASGRSLQLADEIDHELEQLPQVLHIAASRQARLNVVLQTGVLSSACLLLSACPGQNRQQQYGPDELCTYPV